MTDKIKILDSTESLRLDQDQHTDQNCSDKGHISSHNTVDSKGTDWYSPPYHTRDW